jgi:hypothetical protein
VTTVTLDDAIKSKLGKHRTDKEVEDELEGLFQSAGDLLDDDDIDDGFEPFDADATMPEAYDWTPETFDQYLTAEVLLPHHGELVQARVTGRKQGADGNPIGKANANPILDSRVYEAKFHDGSTETFAANVIAESLHKLILMVASLSLCKASSSIALRVGCADGRRCIRDAVRHA